MTWLLESGDPLDYPKRCDAADGIRRNSPRPRRLQHSDTSRAPPRQHNESEDDGDKQELPEFNAKVEEEQRRRNCGLRQTDFAQRAGKAEAVQQTKNERDEPRISLRKTRLAPSSMHDFSCDENDAQGDDSFDWWPRRTDVA